MLVVVLLLLLKVIAIRDCGSSVVVDVVGGAVVVVIGDCGSSVVVVGG